MRSPQCCDSSQLAPELAWGTSESEERRDDEDEVRGREGGGNTPRDERKAKPAKSESAPTTLYLSISLSKLHVSKARQYARLSMRLASLWDLILHRYRAAGRWNK